MYWIVDEELNILKIYDKLFYCRSLNLLFLLIVGSQELNHIVTGDLERQEKSEEGFWLPDIHVPSFKWVPSPLPVLQFKTTGIRNFLRSISQIHTSRETTYGLLHKLSSQKTKRWMNLIFFWKIKYTCSLFYGSAPSLHICFTNLFW